MMGSLVSLHSRSKKLGARTPFRRWRHSRLSERVRHIDRAIVRYRRDLGLMIGYRRPEPGNLDDLAILERFLARADRTVLINEWMLRIKTLEAMITLLLAGEDDGPAI